MFKNMKLSAKIASLTYILILLTALVAFVGYQGFSRVVTGVSTSGQMNELVSELLLTRQQEKDFVISGKGSYAEKVQEHLSTLKNRAANASGSVDSKKSKEQMTTVSNQLSAYEEGFSAYRSLERRKAETLSNMEDKASEAMAKIGEIRLEQQQQLLAEQERSAAFLNEMLEIEADVNECVRHLLEAQIAKKDFMLTKEIKDFDRANAAVGKIMDIADTLLPRLTDPKDKAEVETMVDEAGSFVSWFIGFKMGNNIQSLDNMEKNAANMQAAAFKIRDRQKKNLANAQIETSKQMAYRLRNTDDANQVIRLFLDARRDEKNYILTKDDTYKSSVDEAAAKILTLGSELQGRFVEATNISQVEAVIGAVNAYKTAFDDFATLLSQQEKANMTMLAAARRAQEACDVVQGDEKNQMMSRMSGASTLMIGGAAAAIVFGILLGFFITRSINRGVFSVIEGLTDGSDQVASGAKEVSSASHSLASGASEQAAGIEEISSAMEEMSAMTKSSSDNADEANQHMQEAKGIVLRANESMDHLAGSIEEISKASDETSKIIKTIDEIAFQTNLLALNAAVEAARAGEAGAGFAVVADEVRSLAMRAAEAAKNTESLIESIVKKIKEGKGFVGTTSTAFHEVTLNAEKVAAIVAEIAESSNEQARGIDQVNSSIGEVDKVTQQNAANAEESASASEQMSAQAEHLKKLVGNLINIVGTRKESKFKLLENIKGKKAFGLLSLSSRLERQTNETDQKLIGGQKAQGANQTASMKSATEF